VDYFTRAAATVSIERPRKPQELALQQLLGGYQNPLYGL
jgi:hypothetical protein